MSNLESEHIYSNENLIRIPQIGVIGGSGYNLSPDEEKRTECLNKAYEVGKLLAQSKATLISGGMDGVMEESCRGAYEAGGITVGTPGRDRGSSNKYVTVEVCTPIDVGDYLFAGLLSSDSIIIFPGGAGTQAEIYLAYRNKIPMIVIEGLDPLYDQLIGKTLDASKGALEFLGAKTAEEAVGLALQLSKNRINKFR